MENQKHIIQQQVVEVNFYDKKLAQDVFKEISQLSKTTLGDLTNSLLDKTANADTYIRIDQLELDIGTLNYPIDNIEFAKRYEEELEKALTNYLIKHKGSQTLSSNEESTQNFIASYAQLLTHFLVKGVLPWWASGDTLTKPDKTFFALLNQNPQQLKELLIKNGKQENVRQRLVKQFTETIITEIIHCIEPTEANFIILYHQNISEVQRKQQIIQTQEATFKQALWYFILTYLFVDMGGNFERKMLVKSTLTQMAAHFNISYHKLLYLLTEILESHTDLLQTTYSLPTLIQELKQETDVSLTLNDKIVLGNFIETKIIENPYKALEYYLFFGSLPAEYIQYSPERISILLEEQIKKHPHQFKNLIDTKRKSIEFINRLMSVASQTAVLGIIEIAEPSQSDFIINYYHTTVSLQRKKSIIKTEESEFKKSILQFILSFLFIEHGALFNTKIFVESNVRQLAQHYNTNYKTLLVLLTQSIGEEFATISKNSSLFFIFTEILKDELNKETIPTSSLNATHTLNSDNKITVTEIKDSLIVKDVIIFWLINGYMPWWSSELNQISPLQLLQKLVDTDPVDALYVLKIALQYGIGNNVSLNSVSAPLIKILQNIPNAQLPLELLNELQELSTEINHPISKDVIQNYILQAIFKTYHLKQFNYFDPQLFYTILQQHINKATGISETLISEHINTILKHYNKQVFKNSQTTNDNLQYDNNSSSPLKSPFEKNKISKNEFEFNESLYLNEFSFLNDSNSTLDISLTNMVNKAYDILAYYLIHQQLPSYIKLNNEFTISQLIHRLVIIVFEQDHNLLRNLWQQTNNSIAAKMSLHQSFSIANQQQSHNVANLLKDYEEKDTLHYLKQVSLLPHSSESITELIYYISQQSDAITQKSMHKQFLLLANASKHYASIYKGKVFTDLINTLSNTTLTTLINHYNYLLSLAINDSFERESLLLYFREFSFNWVAQSNPANSNEFFSQFLVFLNQRKNWDIKRLYQQITKLPDILINLNDLKLKAITLNMQQDAEIYITHKNYQQNTIDMVKKALLKHPEYMAAQKENNESPNKLKSEEETKINEGEKIYITNAGLVLLHPFISTLFTRVGLLENGVFINDEAKFRAPHLLQYLVNFSEENPEQELILNKVLCGIEPDEVLEFKITLTELEKQTANELLYVVTQQWEKLKNTSIDGLQTTFLQRDGALSFSSEGWTLIVEKKAFDVLLQTLPWGLSFIKNSWMNQAIFVEWN